MVNGIKSVRDFYSQVTPAQETVPVAAGAVAANMNIMIHWFIENNIFTLRPFNGNESHLSSQSDRIECDSSRHR